MQLPNIDDVFLGEIRNKEGYNPFSFKYNSALNEKLFKRAVAENASEKALGIIQSGTYFHETFFKKLLGEVITCYNQLDISDEDSMELFVAIMNEQELLLHRYQREFLKTTDSLNAFDVHNAVYMNPDFPEALQNFRQYSETLIEIGNIFFRYLFEKRPVLNALPNSKPDAFLFDVFHKIMDLCNKYYSIKTCYQYCLNSNGEIDISNSEQICFDIPYNQFTTIRQVQLTIVENQRLNRLHYYLFHISKSHKFKTDILKHASSLVLSEASIVDGFVTYALQKRTGEDYKVFLDYLTILHDYYPFYSNMPLPRFADLTVTQLLQMHCELKLLIESLYMKGYPYENALIARTFKRNFLPKIEDAVLIRYLTEVTVFSLEQIEAFLQLSFVKRSKDFDLYERLLIKRDYYYYFPYYTATHPNYLFLIDYWLEMADEDVSVKGKALEKYIKAKLTEIEQGKFNLFKLIDQNDFIVTNGQKEEIDLLIETKNTLIIGEVKCVKYPMESRDYLSLLNDTALFAMNQLNRKAKFIIENESSFNTLFTIGKRKIQKVIIFNLPVLNGVDINGIPVVDHNFFLSYFNSGKVVSRTFNDSSVEELETENYYQSEDEFCDNFNSYLSNHPVVRMFTGKLQKTVTKYKFEGLPEVNFSDWCPVSEGSIFREAVS